MRTVLRVIGFVVLALAGPPSFAADTQPAAASGAAGASAARGAPAPAAAGGACIETEVNGYRALSYDCLNQKMAPAAPVRPAPSLESEAVTQRPPNQMGLPTPATIGNRMGNTFGTSAYPQRPQP